MGYTVTLSLLQMALPSLRDSLHPGPKDPSLLTQQDSHISSQIWSGKERLLQGRPHYVRGPKPHESVLAMLKMAGFGYVAQIENFYTDISLIEALVERWRPETRTFHLPQGECTITLEDVALQLGVSIDGEAVTGIVDAEWPALCQELLGAVPPSNVWNGQTVQLSWFATKFANLPDNASYSVIKQYTRGYIMQLIGGLLMPDPSCFGVNLKYLPLLRDLSKVAHLSWGSAILACLYREMSLASKINCYAIGGCLVLLQAWAWDRIPIIAPQVNQFSQDQVHRGFPLACRWSHCKKTTENSSRYVTKYRFSLDQLDVHQFIWTPYTSPDIRRYIVKDPGEVCYAMVPLICFSIVEWHHPDRVMRQFGIRQLIPQPPTTIIIPEVDIRGQGKMHKSVECQTWINLWMQRRSRLIQGLPFHGYLDEISDYMRWYLHVTRRWISPEAAFAGTMVIGVRNILRFAVSETPTTRKKIIQTCNDMLSVSQKYHPSLIFNSTWEPTQQVSRQGVTENVPYKQPLPMGFASNSQKENPFSSTHQSPPAGFAPYPSSSNHAPNTVRMASSYNHSSKPIQPHPMSTPPPPPPPVFTPQYSGTTYQAYPSAPAARPSYHPTVHYSETEEEDDEESDFGSEDISECDYVPTLPPAIGNGSKRWGP